jgi:phosphoglycolate phosphatase-like HAD superfamily hydrolase
LNVFFDVQGTLISAGRGRPGVRETFEDLTGAGHDVYIWSSAGDGYARRAAEALGVEDLILGCYSKDSDPPVSVDFTVDDQPGLSGRHGGITVPPFAGDPDDAELRSVADRILNG